VSFVDGGAKSDIKLGFFIGLGLMLLGLIVAAARMLLSKVSHG
jgi:hypothetical protein